VGGPDRVPAPAGGWPRTGVLAIQGDFEAHGHALARLGITAPEVRRPAELEGLDALILPGGESGAHLRILKENGLWGALAAFHARGGALYGTCWQLHSRKNRFFCDPNAPRPTEQRGSARSLIDPTSAGAADQPLRLVFIRAPRISRVGPGVQVLLTCAGEPVMARQGRVLVSSFHPEVTGDALIHRWFLENVAVRA
jgi:5'-phosphate synthase pdxT subunit